MAGPELIGEPVPEGAALPNPERSVETPDVAPVEEVDHGGGE